MIKVNRLTKKNYYHIATIICDSYKGNFSDFEIDVNCDRVLIFAPMCKMIKITIKDGVPNLLGVRGALKQWDFISFRDNKDLLSYINKLDYELQGFKPSTLITVDESIKMLNVALEGLLTFEPGDKKSFLLDIVDSYKEQLKSL